MSELEFSHPVYLDKLATTGVEKKLVANEDERKRLAERFGLLGLLKLEAELIVEPAGTDQTIPVTGKVKAEVVQQCVVTLEPLTNQVAYTIDVLYAPPDMVESGSGGVNHDEPETEVIVNGMIDLGELVAQHLGIALDPYPRKAGAHFVDAEYGQSVTKGPLAELANWSKKPKD